MITFNNIVTAFQTFTNNHFFLKTFSFGNSEDMDLPKYNEYPLLHLNYTGADYDEGTKTYNFEIFVLDLPSDKLDKVSYQREVISDAEQCVEDLLADVLNGGNIFQFADQYEVTSASVTPLEEETKNVLAGVLLTLAIEVPYQYDSCDAPLEGVTPTPSGDCPVAVVQNTDLTYQVDVTSGGTLTLPNISVTEVDGSSVDVPAQTNVVCEWKTIRVLDQDDNVLATQAIYPVGGDIDVVVSSATTYPQIIHHRKPSYPSTSTGDYPDLFSSGYFDLYRPSIAVQMIQLGADNYTLAQNNRFGNTSRYTSTDGTPSNTGTARFSSYGGGVPNVVRDNYLSIMWYNLPLGGSSTTLNNSQSEADAQNALSLAGFTDWIVPTRDMLSISCSPDNNQAIHTSPNLIEDVGTRRYMTCERLPYISQGYQVFYSNGGEATQSLTTTASGQNRVVIARIMTLTELFG